MIIRARLVLHDTVALGNQVPLTSLADVMAEFPTLEIGIAREPRRDALVSVEARAWSAPDVDLYAYDRQMGAFENADEGLDVHGHAKDVATVALQVLTRYQRHVRRRNVASRSSSFDRLLARHRALHDLERPLVRADYDHALDVWQWVLRLEGEASFALQAAALLHDVERLVSEADVRIEHKAEDYEAFKAAHARAGAELADRVLVDAGVDASTRREAALLVERHERAPAGVTSLPGADLATLHDADALSFFSLNSPGFVDYYGLDHAKKKVRYTLSRMSPRARGWLDRVRLRSDVADLVAGERRVTRSLLEASP